MKNIPDELKKRPFRHIGIGFPDRDTVCSIVNSLIEWGATVTKKDDDSCKYFLKLNPGDVSEIEIFFSEKGVVNVHFDKSVEDIVVTGDACDEELFGCDVPHIYFLPLVTIFATLVKKVEVEMAFCEESFDWTPWIPKMDEAAARNEALQIDIPEKEWEKLEAEDMASLKARLTETAADRLHLFGCTTMKRFIVTVYRICGPCMNR